ncbi:HlyD family secretion protein [Massilia sp. BSC265]|uniref:HlyD family secretion protein n=1 Tax=Massilia sp. BSC265 TaxID=1549812 RepID=UPI0004E922E8|nr:HlyD family efflux transporter periplasmic adaptor subunit [Massilia sp. BSC265]KFI07770.1 hypothetical protein JN27_09480 [Massilia sp. BSC265]
MTTSPLFRPDANASRQTRLLGDIVVNRPVSMSLLSFFAVLAMALVLGFLAWGTYTRRSTVPGQLIPSSGIIRVFAPQQGLVVRKYVAEGQVVRRGQALYALSSERQSPVRGGVVAAVGADVRRRHALLQEERSRTALLQEAERRAALAELVGLRAFAATMRERVDNQRKRVRLAEEAAARYQSLVAQHYVSKEQALQREEALLDQRSRLQADEGELLAAQRDIESRQRALASLALRDGNQLARLDREIAGTRQELNENEARREVIVSAPEDGVATGMLAETGQAVDSSRPLLTIVPRSAPLQVHLFAPSRKVGFVSPGDEVRVRFQAFPYQKFGHGRGKVLSVSQFSLRGSELAEAGYAFGQAMQDEPAYRITVALARQSVEAGGRSHPLQAGMLVDAEIFHETRRLYEWVFEPLYGLSAKLR